MKKIKIGLIPAAGKGSRISDLPLTRILPKPMLPVLNKPILENVIYKMKEMGVEVIYLVVGFKKGVIREYFQDGRDFGVEIRYIEQDEPKGIARAIALAETFIKEPFVVVLGDDFTVNSSFEDLANFFLRKEALVVEAVVKESDMSALKRACSVLLDDEGRVLDIIEKPENPQWLMRGCGVYIFDPEIFRFIEKASVSSERKDITDIIKEIALTTQRVYGVEVDTNININTLEDLNRATLLLIGRSGNGS